jgi:hypothetical protein
VLLAVMISIGRDCARRGPRAMRGRCQ